MSWETVVGLEVHVQLQTRTKAFCRCEAKFGGPPNTRVCPVCLGLPGALPVLNDRAVDFSLRAAIALDCEIPPVSIFARKNYFYPDLPKGYQISQYDRPLATGGRVPIEQEGRRHSVELVRIHLEEDAGKSMHGEGADTGSDTRIDLNRCGTPLIEIVSTPTIRSAAEAGAYIESLRRIVQYLGISDGDMSQGSLRCDANVSVRRAGETELGTKAELKNLNSIKAVEKAIDVEAKRQGDELEAGRSIEPATLLWDESTGRVRPMRSKEDAPDYRYFPEPDLMPLVIDAARLARVRAEIPELPFARRDRFVAEFGIPEYDAGVLTGTRPLADWFEEVARITQDAKAASNWTMGEVLRIVNETGVEIGDFAVTPEKMGDLLGLVTSGAISGSAAKTVFAKMALAGGDPAALVESEGLSQISDEASVREIVESVVKEHPEQAEQYRAGNRKVVGYLMGQVMQASRGQVNPKLGKRLLEEILQGGSVA